MKTISNQKGTTLVTTLGFLAVLAVMAATTTHSTLQEISSSNAYRKSQTALYIAEAGVRHGIRVTESETFNNLFKGADGNVAKIDDNGFIVNSAIFGGGTYTVRITEKGGTWNDTDGRAVITSTGIFGDVTKVITVEIARIDPATANLHAAITTNGTLRLTGTMTIDGRNHTADGIPLEDGTGIRGISTKGNTDFDTANVKIGGTTAEKEDMKPEHDPDAKIVEANATWKSSTTPEEILGLEPGTLKNIAKSGVGGSQYVTNPAGLKMPLKGITYVEGDWSGINLAAGSSGILVVHNATTTATAKNFNTKSEFKGVIIADKIELLKGTVVGAVALLSKEKVHAGTGQGTVLYSKETIQAATPLVPLPLKTISWQE